MALGDLSSVKVLVLGDDGLRGTHLSTRLYNHAIELVYNSQ